MRNLSVRFDSECWIWSITTSHVDLEASGMILSPLMDFYLKQSFRVGPTFYQDYLVWKFRLLHWVQNIKFGRVAYLFCVHGVPNKFETPRQSSEVCQKPDDVHQMVQTDLVFTFEDFGSRSWSPRELVIAFTGPGSVREGLGHLAFSFAGTRVRSRDPDFSCLCVHEIFATFPKVKLSVLHDRGPSKLHSRIIFLSSLLFKDQTR